MTLTSLESAAKKICNSDQIMVYGYQHCNYLDIIDQFDDSTTSPYKKVFGYECGDASSEHETLEGSKITKISYDSTTKDLEKTARWSKSGIVNIVFENFKRKKLGMPIIPIMFCVDINDNPYGYSLADITSKKPYITNKEIRRCYRLCEKIADLEIRAVARETLRFVKVSYDEDTEVYIDLEQIKAPWESSKWKPLWEDRMKKKTVTRPGKTIFWEKELAKIKATYLCKSELNNYSLWMVNCSAETRSEINDIITKFVVE